jgi:hypothetical protein
MGRSLLQKLKNLFSSASTKWKAGKACRRWRVEEAGRGSGKKIRMKKVASHPKTSRYEKGCHGAGKMFYLPHKVGGEPAISKEFRTYGLGTDQDSCRADA